MPTVAEDIILGQISGINDILVESQNEMNNPVPLNIGCFMHQLLPILGAFTGVKYGAVRAMKSTTDSTQKRDETPDKFHHNYRYKL